MKRGNWTDNPCWYCSVRDAGRTALVLGPFATEGMCRQWAYYADSDTHPDTTHASGGSVKHGRLLNAAQDRDPKSWFYSWGMVKLENGYREGVLNRFLPEAEADMLPMGHGFMPLSAQPEVQS